MLNDYNKHEDPLQDGDEPDGDVGGRSSTSAAVVSVARHVKVLPHQRENSKVLAFRLRTRHCLNTSWMNKEGGKEWNKQTNN